jgi:hypothetical protein
MLQRAHTKSPARTATACALAAIGVLSLANSWGSLYAAAAEHLAHTGLPTITVRGHSVSLAAASLPLLLDLLIVAASRRYVIGVREGRPVGGWRVAAHAAIAGTVLMNALAAEDWTDVPWHVIAPAVLAVVVELVARESLGTLRETRDDRGERIPLMLWVTRPGESARTTMRRFRDRATAEVTSARMATEAARSAKDALRLVLPGVRNFGRRRMILARLWSGALDPAHLLALITAHRADSAQLVWAVLGAVGQAGPDGPRAVGQDSAQWAMGRGPDVGPDPMGQDGPPAGQAVGPDGPEADDDGGPWAEAVVEPLRAGPSRPSRPSVGGARGATGSYTLQHLIEAIEDGRVTKVTRQGIKDSLGIRSNTTAGALLAQYREHQELSQTV